MSYTSNTSRFLSTTRARPQSSTEVEPEFEDPKDGEPQPSHSGQDLSPAETIPHMRAIMRQLPHPVVVITSSVPPPQAGTPRDKRQPHDADPTSAATHDSTPYANYRAMTVSSFTTVTLGPPPAPPIISFNIRTPSRTLTALLARQHFRVHMLAGTPAGARIADAFTRGNAEAAFAALDAQGVGIAFDAQREPWAPRLVGRGVSADLACRVLEGKCVEVGDHVVVVAEVRGVAVHGPRQRKAVRDGSRRAVLGLMYVDRAYRMAGAPIDLAVGMGGRERNAVKGDGSRLGTDSKRPQVRQDEEARVHGARSVPVRETPERSRSDVVREESQST